MTWGQNHCFSILHYYFHIFVGYFIYFYTNLLNDRGAADKCMTISHCYQLHVRPRALIGGWVSDLGLWLVADFVGWGFLLNIEITVRLFFSAIPVPCWLFRDVVFYSFRSLLIHKVKIHFVFEKYWFELELTFLLTHTFYANTIMYFCCWRISDSETERRYWRRIKIHLGMPENIYSRKMTVICYFSAKFLHPRIRPQ